ncbi:hypothetical protein LX36DRAFT_45169 [Colletotrichum falcatum]|nr:hypothetical protein LX36DRAFT_45169 [Colletotrichum falcatum]
MIFAPGTPKEKGSGNDQRRRTTTTTTTTTKTTTHNANVHKEEQRDSPSATHFKIVFGEHQASSRGTCHHRATTYSHVAWPKVLDSTKNRQALVRSEQTWQAWAVHSNHLPTYGQDDRSCLGGPCPALQTYRSPPRALAPTNITIYSCLGSTPRLTKSREWMGPRCQQHTPSWASPKVVLARRSLTFSTVPVMFSIERSNTLYPVINGAVRRRPYDGGAHSSLLQAARVEAPMADGILTKRVRV